METLPLLLAGVRAGFAAGLPPAVFFAGAVFAGMVFFAKRVFAAGLFVAAAWVFAPRAFAVSAGAPFVAPRDAVFAALLPGVFAAGSLAAVRTGGRGDVLPAVLLPAAISFNTEPTLRSVRSRWGFTERFDGGS